MMHAYPGHTRGDMPARAFRPIQPQSMARAKGRATAAPAMERRPTLPEAAAGRAREAVVKPRGVTPQTAGRRPAAYPKGQAMAPVRPAQSNTDRYRGLGMRRR